MRFSTSSVARGRPRTRAIDVTPRSAMPHGTIKLKLSRLVFTLSAKPWLVIQRAIRTPIAATFSLPTQTPVKPATRPRVDPVFGDRANKNCFEIAHVTVHVAAVGIQVDDRVADDLPWTMIGDVASAPRLVHVDAACREHVRRRQDMSAAAVAANAERQDVRML